MNYNLIFKIRNIFKNNYLKKEILFKIHKVNNFDKINNLKKLPQDL